jgi:hypothetical protein
MHDLDASMATVGGLKRRAWIRMPAGWRSDRRPLSQGSAIRPRSHRHGELRPAGLKSPSVLAIRDGLDAVVEVHDVLVGHANAARLDLLADRLRFLRAVEAVKRAAKIDDTRAERIFRPPGMKRGRSGRRRSIWESGVQDGHSRFIATLRVPI